MISLVFLCLLPTVFGGYLESLAASAAASGPSKPARFEGMVAFHCGLPALHRSPDGIWERDIYQDCVNSDEEVRRYCQRVYPLTKIVNVERAPVEFRMANWCTFDKAECPKAKVLTVRPYRCLDTAFQSDALLVPTGCNFGHMVPGMSSPADVKKGTCKSQQAWNVTATKECARRYPGFTLRRLGGLVPCAKDKKHSVGYFKGAEFVCCPKSQARALPRLVKVYSGADPNALPRDGKAPKKAAAAIPSVLEPAVLGPSRDRYVDYLNRANDDEESEHDRYMDAKDSLRQKMRKHEDSLVKSFIEAEHSLDDMWAVDKPGAEDLEKKVIERFRTVFGALLDEEMEEWRTLDHVHQKRVAKKLHDKSERSRKMLEYAEQEADPLLNRISEAAFTFLRSIMKEKVHAINHYSHLLESDPKEAKIQFPQLMKELNLLHDEIKKELDRLATQPEPLRSQVKDRILQFMRTYSEVEASVQSLMKTGKLSADTPTGRSRQDLELEHMESVINAYKHNAAVGAKKKSEKPKKVTEPLVHVLPVPGEEEEEKERLADKEVTEEKKWEHPHRPIWYHAKALHDGNDVDHDHDHDHGEGHYDGDGHDHHRNERTGGAVQSSTVTWVVIACVAVAAMVAAASALLVLRRRYAGYSQAPAGGASAAVETVPTAVGVEAPSVADLAAMQTNGYENPTYKYFELRGKSEDVSEA